MGCACYDNGRVCYNIVHKAVGKAFRRYRIIIVEQKRSQIFRQIVQIERRKADAFQAKFVQEDGKGASFCRQSLQGVNCAVLPLVFRLPFLITDRRLCL